MQRRIRYAAAVGLLAVGAAGCGGSTSATSAVSTGKTPSGTTTAASPGSVVSLKLLQFRPMVLRVPVGTTVTWRNDEPITHTVTSGAYRGVDPNTGLRASEQPDGRFDLHLATTGRSGSYTFTKPGTYPYYCSIHKGMNGKVIVTR